MPVSFFIALKPNQTFPVRQAVWTPATMPTGPTIGVLSVVERRSEKGIATISRYAVLELEFVGGRRFKVTKPGGKEVYYTFLSASGPEYDECDCDGFQAHNRCKHSEAIRGLQLAGHLPMLLERIMAGPKQNIEGA